MPTQPVVVEPAPRRVREDKTKYAEIASFIQIYKGDVLKASGKIVGRTLDQIVTVSAYTVSIHAPARGATGSLSLWLP